MLPGDFIAYKLSGNFSTTSLGLSEGIMWDFRKRNLSQDNLAQAFIHILDEKIFFSIKTEKDNSLVTTFHSDRAKPFVKKYKRRQKLELVVLMP